MPSLVSKWIRRAGLAGALLSLATVPATSSTNCQVSVAHCRAKLNLSVYTGTEPIPFCLQNVPIVQIVSRAACSEFGAGPVVALRCGILDIPVVYSGSGFTHVIGTTTSWGDVLGGACGDLTYSVHVTP